MTDEKTDIQAWYLSHCHSGLDPGFDRLITLSKLERESSFFFSF
jgi:hypothetical protein